MPEPTETDRKACRRKRRFSTRIKAEVNALAEMNNRARGKAIYTYHCPACNGHHLTRTPHRYADSKLWPKDQRPPDKTCKARVSSDRVQGESSP